MKPRILNAARLSFPLASALAALLAAPSAQAAIYYWDDNASVANFGTAGASTGTWAAPTAGTVAGWSLSTTGANAFAAFTTATTDTLNFGNGATGLAAGTITVSGTVNAGDMTFAAGSGAIVLSGGTAINLAATETTTVNNTTDTISSVLTGAATSFAKAGNGILILSGANTYTGGTTINAGTLSAGDVTNNKNLGASTGGVTLNGGTLTTTSNVTATTGIFGSRTVTVGASGGTLNVAGTATTGQNSRLIFNTASTLLGSGALSLTGTGGLDGFNGAKGVVVVTAAQTYNGAITLSSGGLLAIETGGSLGSGATIAIGNNAEFSIGTVNVTNNVTVTGGTTSQMSFANTGLGDLQGTLTLNAALTIGKRNWFNATANNGKISGVISGAGNFSTDGSGTLTLTGANTYTGNTTVSGGLLNITNAANTTTGVFIIGTGATLNLSSFSDYGVASAMGNRLQTSETTGTDSATTGIGLHFQGGTLQYTGSTAQSTNRMIRLINATTNTIDASGTGSGTLTFTGAVAQVNLFDTSGTRTLNLTGSNTGNNTFGIILTDQAANATSLIKSGNGTWVLTGASSNTGGTTVAAGTLILSGSGTLGGATTGTVSIGNTTSSTGTLVISSSSASAINIAAGGSSLLVGAGTTAGIVGNLYLAPGMSTTGVVTQASTTADVNIGWANAAAGNATGNIFQSAGTFNQSAGHSFYLGLVNSASGTGSGTYNIDGGTLNTASTFRLSGSNNIAIAAGTATGTLNVTGTGLVTATGGFRLLDTAATAALTRNATVNLNSFGGNSGVLQTVAWSAAGGGTGTGTLNFNGGTLKMGASDANFLSATTSAVNIYANGATINTNGNTSTITQVFQNPASNGLTSVTVTTADTTTVFTTPPTVTFTGGTATTAATGYATLDTSGKINGIVITNGGIYTVNPTGITIAGSTEAGTPVAAANNTGGLTKSSTGTLTLTSATNSYAGNTAITGGTLQIGTAGKLGSGSYAGTVAISTAAFLQYSSSANQTLSGAVSGLGGLTKDTDTTSTLTLTSATNSYTGATTVSAGTMAITSTGILANTAIGVTGTSTFKVTPGSGTVNLGNSISGASLGATLNLGSGTTFSMVDGATGTTNLVQGGSFGTALTLAGATLNFDVGAPAAADKLAVTGTSSTASVSGTNIINITPVTGFAAGANTLISTANAIGGLGGTYVFGGSGTTTQTVAFGTNSYLMTLSSAANAVTVTTGAATALSGGVLTWSGQTNGTGAANSSWDNGISNNWAANSTTSTFNNGVAVSFGDTNAANSNAAITNSTVTVAAGGVTPTSTTFNNTNVNYTVSNASGVIGIAGSGGLTKSGTGSVTLNGANTFTGGVSISNGNLILGNTAALNSTVGSENAVAFGAATTGTLTLNGNSVIIANLTGSVAGPVVQNNLTGTATLTVGNSVGSGGTYAGSLQNGAAGTLAFTKAGAGTLTLSGTNSYTGATTINAGTLAAGSSTAFNNTSALSMSGTSILDLASFNASFTDVAASVAGNTITNSVTGTSTLSITNQTNTIVGLVTNGGSGKVLAVNLTNNNGGNPPFTLTNANTFSGGLTLLNSANGTRLNINAAITSSPFGTGTITVGQTATDKAGIFFSSAANNTLVNAVTFNTSLGTDRKGLRLDTTGNTLAGLITANADLVVSSNGTGSGSLTGQITGAGGLILDMSAGGTALTVTLNNAGTANNYQGDTIINQGATAGRNATLTLGRANQIPNGASTGNVTINTATTGIGTLNLNNFAETINGLNGNGIVDGAITGGTTNTLTLGDNNATGSFSGTIKNTTGSLSLIKIGTGTQTLSGSNSYTGGTAIKAGTLQVDTGGTLGAITNALTMGTGSAGTLGTVGNLTINTNTQVGAMTVAQNTATVLTTDIAQLSILSVKTLTASSLTVGVTAATAGATKTALGTGATPGALGTLTVNGNVSIGVAATNAVLGTTVADLSGLSNFNVTSTGVGSLLVGFGQDDKATLTLANTANVLNVGTLSVGDSNGNFVYDLAGQSTVNLGAGTNALQAPAINIGASKGGGTIQFAGAGGSVTITGANGSGTANITIGNASILSYQGTGTNSLLLAGHTATVSAGTVIIAEKTGGVGGLVSGLVTFDTGTFGATSIQMALINNANATNGANGTFTVGGPTANSAATGVVNVSGNIILAGNTVTDATASTATGTLTINGGTVNVNTLASATGGIFDTTTSSNGTSATTLTLAGGTLNLNGGVIGGTTGTGKKNIGTLTFASGTLQNVLEINGGAGLTKTGTGTLILSGTNSFTGTVTINDGTVQLGSATGLRSTAGTQSLVTFGASAASTARLALGGNSVTIGNLTTNATPGTPIVENANAGNATLTVGTATAGTSQNLSGTYAGTIQDGTGGGTLALTKAGTGTLTLTGTNTYTGATAVTAGTLQIGSAGTLGAGAYAGAVSIANTATLQHSSTAAQTLSGVISGSGAILKDAISDFTLSNSGNTFNGTITVTAGRVNANTSPGNLSNGAASLVQSGIGQFYISNNLTLSNNFNLNGTGFAEGDTQANSDGAIRMDGTNTLSGTITLSGNARIGANGNGANNTISGKITGSAAIEFYGMNNGNNSAEVFTISNSANDYTGATTITNSNYNSAVLTGVSTTLKLGASNVIPDGASAGNVAFSINGTNPDNTVILDLNGFSDTINGTTVNTGANAKITNSATGTSVLTIGANDTISTFGGAITDAGAGKTLALIKTGIGTLTLTGANTYTGATTLTGGTLTLGANSALSAASNVSIGSATLDAATFTDTAGTLAVTGTSVINLGSGGALAFANSSAVTWTGTLNITGTFVSGSSINFGASSSGLTSGQLARISINGSGAGSCILNSSGYLVLVGPLDHFNISSISSPQTAGTAITGITFTAKDASNNTVTSFIGTVSIGGTGGFTGTSASFTAGVLSSVSGVTPTVSGSSLTLTVTDSATPTAHTGTTTIGTINPATLDHFAISSISSPQTAGTPITGITFTAKDAFNNTVTSFTGTVSTVSIGGTGGFTGTSASFTAGVLSSVSGVTPTVSGSSLTLTVTDGATPTAHTGTATIGTINPGAVDHFAISSITGTKTVGTAITGVTLTAQDANNNTATSFVSPVTFGGTGGFTGTSASFTAGVKTGVSITPTVAGSNLTFTVTDGASPTAHTGSTTIATIQSTYNAWASGTFANAFTDTDPAHNPDNDGLTNLQEYAFGTDPTVSSGGSIEWVAGGAVTNPGVPVAHDFSTGGGGVDYRAVYGRRKDYVAAGLTYTVQFSADMILWQSSVATPTVLTGAGGLNPSEIEAVSVPYPSLFVPLNAGGFGKATFLRVGISQ